MDASEVGFKLSIELARADDTAGRPAFAREAAAVHLWHRRREELRRAYREPLREFAS